MTTHHRIEQTLLWIFVILSAFVIGGGLYEMRVIVPLWANSPPDSNWYWEAQRLTNPQYAPDSGLRFWIYLTPLHFLISTATLIAGWKTVGAHRRWLIVSTVIFVLMHASAFVWFVPVLGQLEHSRALGLSAEQVISKTRWWVMLTWGRCVIGLIGFVCGLRALQVPL